MAAQNRAAIAAAHIIPAIQSKFFIEHCLSVTSSQKSAQRGNLARVITVDQHAIGPSLTLDVRTARDISL
jgi:hypothetical protein